MILQNHPAFFKKDNNSQKQHKTSNGLKTAFFHV